jgi:hypothetical protein
LEAAVKRAAKKKRSAAAKKPRTKKAMVELTRGEAYALLAGVSAALEDGLAPPADMQADLFSAVAKFRQAFGFEEGEEY